MHRQVLPCAMLPKQISVREHDYSIRLIRSAEVDKTPGRNNRIESKFNGTNEVYELTELFIEPIVTNIVKVSDVSFRINMPLEDVCHTENALEISPIDDLTFQEDLCSVSHLNDTCNICLKDLKNVFDKISFFDDNGEISTEMTSISSALEAMNVEVTRDDKMPQQICIECYNIFSKMALFEQICQRSKRALDKICDFTTKHFENVKAEVDIFYGSSAEIVEIKEEYEELDPIPIPTFDLQILGDEDMSQLSTQYSPQHTPRHQPRNRGSTNQDPTKSFICIRCGGNFPDQVSLLHHKRSRICVDESDPECRVCKAKLPSIDDLDRHLTTSHHCFSCTKCTKSFQTLLKYNKHQRYHETFTCDFCAHVCYTKRNIRDHLMSHVVGLYPCSFCNQRFGSRKRLGIHKKKVHPNELYKCPHCIKEFKLKDTYRVHLMKHNPDKPHKCSYCSKQFVHRHHLVNHTRTHTKEYPFLCNFCGKTFRGDESLRDHLSKHDPKLYPRRPSRYRNSYAKKQQCNLCSYTSSHGNLKKHMFKHGEVKPLPKFEFSCQICDKQFRLAASLEKHLPTHDEVRNFHCTLCKASFTKSHYLRIHIDGVHLKKRPNKCDQCDAAYFMSNDLKRHKLQKHSTERPFQCYLCQKTYTMAIFLRKHIKNVHKAFRGDVALRGHLSIHDPKMYPRRYRLPPKMVHCNLCNFKTTFGNMKKHMINSHGKCRPLGKFEFSCHICDKQFRLSASLENHLVTHNEIRDFHCTYCKASFRKAHYLRLHIDGVHLKKRPNKCDKCDAAYLISNDLKRHKMQKHSTDRPYQCYYCQKTFGMAIYLKTHINRVHSLEN